MATLSQKKAHQWKKGTSIESIPNVHAIIEWIGFEGHFGTTLRRKHHFLSIWVEILYQNARHVPSTNWKIVFLYRRWFFCLKSKKRVALPDTPQTWIVNLVDVPAIVAVTLAWKNLKICHVRRKKVDLYWWQEKNTWVKIHIVSIKQGFSQKRRWRLLRCVDFSRCQWYTNGSMSNGPSFIEILNQTKNWRGYQSRI